MKKSEAFPLLFIEVIVIAVCFIIIGVVFIFLMKNMIITTIYCENITHSTMLEFTMLNSNLINNGSINTPERTCAKETLLPIKLVIPIGLLEDPGNPENPFEVGYRGYDVDVEMHSCIPPYLDSLGYATNILQGIAEVSVKLIEFGCINVLPVYRFTPVIGDIGHISHVQIYFYYENVGCGTDNKCYHFPKYLVRLLASATGLLQTYIDWIVNNIFGRIPYIGQYWDDKSDEEILKTPKTTYAYIVLPNSEITTAVTKTS